MLYGMSLVYGITGTTNLHAIAGVLDGQRDHRVVGGRGHSSRAGFAHRVMAVFFVVVGFAFKISAVPFHFWAPDTYEGAPSPVAAFLSTASKIGGFVDSSS